MKIKLFFLTAIIFSLAAAFAQDRPRISVFGAKSDIADPSRNAQIQDLLVHYLADFDEFDVSDKRDEFLFANSNETDDFAFFVEIQQAGGNFVCTYRIIKPQSTMQVSEVKVYPSYNRFLLDMKSSLRHIFDSALAVSRADGEKAAKIASLEDLSGNWLGEETIEKVTILRGGNRGLVFFKDGASMGVSLEIDGEDVIVRQSVRSNALYFPDLPRNIALAAAVDAEPLEWHFSAVSATKLAGVKKTLQPVTEDGIVVSAAPVEIPIVWTRK